MDAIKINNKKQLNDFVGAQKHSQFLQSWQWGEFHKTVSENVFRVGVEDGGKLVAAATIIKKALPMGKKYFYCPRGPIIDKSQVSNPNNQTNPKSQIPITKQIIELLRDTIKQMAQEEGAMFLRFDPTFKITDYQLPIVKTINIEPDQTLILNLEKSEAELLKGMHPKTRYNIKLAEKRGVKIIEAGSDRFEEFWQLMCQTGERDNFRTHGISYYKEMLKADNDFIKLFFAEYKGKPISSIIVAFFGDTATYAHGASSSEDRNVMAPYLSQWHCVKLAKELGYKYYDFYGINAKRWPGVTKFKKGFGGKEINYPGTYDLVFDKNWYGIYKMVRKVRRTF
ncbi:peptidoglycan bridge formation glycyltransferase FemA/FemB family protein [Patescibacteria group bacterium]|nr:peptidoglycan bridge formation glycyltransferase FemA/FemB family protein [Patescibacteria group bacterium]MBU4455497.1 peptidoglycan bridge formation glycyltransferase FemA/FemB family protein [Patescibacteria group bacterium]MCG2690628.1 peptidoglycan bridge formation glycyltransferase FemA/FemB family protein [Candidatus Parcubacteria bacterium]